MSADLIQAGARLESAQAAVILVHGRGASAASMLEVAGELSLGGSAGAGGVAFVAPQAPGYTWYPNSFLAPIEQNEPDLSIALQKLSGLLERLKTSGVPAEHILLLGFSQGACLVLEFAARNARRYGGIAGLSGGLIGPPGTPRIYPGSFDNTPIFIGCSDVDPHIPLVRVQESAQVLERMGADVEARIYPGMAHTVNEDEIEAVRKMIVGL